MGPVMSMALFDNTVALVSGAGQGVGKASTGTGPQSVCW